MKRALAAAMAAAWMTTGLAADAQPAWSLKLYDGFLESVDALVGEAAVDCGFFDRHRYELSKDRLEAGRDCVQNALRGEQPFKFATIAPGSNAVYLLLRAKDGQLWTVRYSHWIANSHLHEDHINQTCESAMIDEALQVHGIDCKFVANGALPTHVRPNPGH